MKNIPVSPKEIRLLVQPYKDYFSKLLFAMDDRHAEEFARYDRASGILHVNGALLAQAPVWAVYFYLFRALRYAQLCHEDPSLTEPDVQASLPYAIVGVGECAKWDGKTWRTCSLEGNRDFFEAAWRGIPYERECVEYATQEAYDMLSWDLDRDNLHLLAQMHAPRRALTKEEFARLFAQIDAATDNK